MGGLNHPQLVVAWLLNVIPMAFLWPGCEKCRQISPIPKSPWLNTPEGAPRIRKGHREAASRLSSMMAFMFETISYLKSPWEKHLISLSIAFSRQKRTQGVDVAKMIHNVDQFGIGSMHGQVDSA